jgi:hypothetical protein
MRPFVHGDDAVATAFRRREHRPSCDYGFYAAHQISLDAWHSWIADQGEATARLDEATAARPPVCRGMAIIRRLRQAIGATLIGIGQRVQGASSRPRVSPEPKGTG